MDTASSKLGQGLVSKRTKLLSVPMILILLCGFFLPWGAGTQKFASLYVSKLFAAFGLLLIIYWTLFARDKFKVFPPFFNYFILFIALHIFVTHFLISSEGFTFEYLGFYKFQRTDFIRFSESFGIQIARVFIFILLAYAVAYFLENDSRVTALALAYGTGLTVTMMIGGYVHVSVLPTGTDTRLSAGFLDPSYFGSNAFSVIFLNLLVALRPKLNIVAKLFATGYILIAMLGLLSSSSRSALLALCIGFMVILIYMPGILKKIRLVSVSLLLAVAIFALVPQNYRETLKARISVERLLADQKDQGGKGRLELWPEYLKQTPKYFLTGNGFGRAVEALEDSSVLRYVPHNEFLSVFVQYGIVGLLCFFLALCQLWKRVRYRMHQYKTTARDAVYLGFFSAWLVFICFYNVETVRNWWFSLGIIAAYACSRTRVNCNSSEDVGLDVSRSMQI